MGRPGGSGRAAIVHFEVPVGLILLGLVRKFAAGGVGRGIGIAGQLAQLERLDEFVPRKRRIFDRYTELLSGAAGIQLPVAKTNYATNINWVYGIVLDDSVPFDADEAMKQLAAKNVGTRPFFWPMHEQPVLHKMGLLRNESHPVSERIARRGFYIPSGLALMQDQMDQVAAAVRTILQ